MLRTKTRSENRGGRRKIERTASAVSVEELLEVTSPFYRIAILPSRVLVPESTELSSLFPTISYLYQTLLAGMSFAYYILTAVTLFLEVEIRHVVLFHLMENRK